MPPPAIFRCSLALMLFLVIAAKGRTDPATFTAPPTVATTSPATLADLTSAIKAGRVEDVRRMLTTQRFKLYESVAEGGWAPLRVAVSWRQLKIAEMLILCGADVNQRAKDGSTALHSAAMAGAPYVTLLLDYAADKKIKDNDGVLPVQEARKASNHDTEELLIDYKPTLNYEQRRAARYWEFFKEQKKQSAENERAKQDMETRWDAKAQQAQSKIAHAFSSHYSYGAFGLMNNFGFNPRSINLNKYNNVFTNNLRNKDNSLSTINRQGLVKSAPAYASNYYSGEGIDHWISEKLDGGDIIKLEDGSLWQVDPIDHYISAIWIPIDDITVIDGDNPFYPYRLINDDEIVNAKLISE